MKNELEIKNNKKKSLKKFPSLDKFKRKGKKLVDDMQQAVLISINLRNLKYFNEIYGTKEGDILIQNDCKRFLFTLCSRHDPCIGFDCSDGNDWLAMFERLAKSEVLR